MNCQRKENNMSKVIHYKSEGFTCTTPCPHRKGVLIGSRKCGKCVFLKKIDDDSNMLICDWDEYYEH